MIPLLADPWAEEPATRAGAAVAQLLTSRRRLEEIAPQVAGDDARLQAALQEASRSLARLAEAIQADEAVYRAHRALIVVQLPSLLAVLQGVAEARLKGTAAERLGPVLVDLHRLLAAPGEALGAIETERLERLALEARVATAALHSPEAAPPGAPSRWGSLLGRAKAGSGEAMASMAAIGTDAGRRVGSAAAAMGSYASASAIDRLRAFTDPVIDSVSAARMALTLSAVTGLVAGAVTGLLCPPLVPFVAGLALLDAPDTFSTEMDRAARARALDRELRRRLRGEDLERALALLTGASRRTRIETPVLQIVFDLDGGTPEGTILAGRFAGRPLASIGPVDFAELIRWAPDEDTAQALAAFRQAMTSKGA